MVIVEGVLHSNVPHIERLEVLKYKYIIGIKPDGNKGLFEWGNAGGCKEFTIKKEFYTYVLCWLNDAPLNKTTKTCA